jgi:hypothetical protein
MREFLLSASWAQSPANARRAKPLKILQRAKGFEPSTPDLGKVVLNAQSVEITHIPEAASAHFNEVPFLRLLVLIIEQKLNILLPFCYPIRW